MTKVLWMIPSAELGEDNCGVEQSLGIHFGLLEFTNTVQEMVEVFAEQALLGGVDQSDFLSRAGTEERLFESRVDGLVAYGLSLAIDQLSSFLDYTLLALHHPCEFLPSLFEQKQQEGPQYTECWNICFKLHLRGQAI
ncbi:hypothetical protein PTTG_27208 [Puccinia triticina 1-1 BBBD Race 1]|uniref:Uncharacterized protein n=1 Tax=Puccinia triticina (isolate 1-1 / race 1 (BBBD)) TaxID=630390 RepID=A0A180GN71_PUCT1|nr:hypothetical protein PTTG_27208 [Puccinia triticina 1-1 BBBD Race 1]